MVYKKTDLPALPADDLDSPVFTIPQFCRYVGIGETHYYELRKKGLGPQEFRLGSCVRISKKSALEWIAMMEERTARLDAKAKKATERQGVSA